MRVVLVSHTHWDREWYRTFQAFRARLVDTVDRVLDLLGADPGYVFVLDGQSVILEDYLEVRPGRRAELEAFVGAGRLAIGPWYVQPDSLLPSGEAHVRNLLEGRRVGSAIGPVSTVAYTPDSFGHPAQLPQILRGFGLEAFVYWRGNPDDRPASYLWASPDGSEIVACHLRQGYFSAASLGDDVPAAVARLTRLMDDLPLLMNGADHLPPDANTAEVARALAEATGAEVVRGRLEDFVAGVPDELPRFGGELVGGRAGNLLPGVWSTRTPLKLRNRRCEALLEGWAEPWAALGRALGLPDERPSLRAAWRSLLQNQAHDSICGCSQDAVHTQMGARYDAASELAQETCARVLERIAGLDAVRRTPSPPLDVAVFNPSPHPRTDVVRFPIDAHPPFSVSRVHPLLRAAGGFTVDSSPARMVAVDTNDRPRLLPEQSDRDVEFVARDVPAFGYRTYRLEPSDLVGDEEDDGTTIEGASASRDGTLAVRFGDAVFEGLCRLEDTADRGDTYDFDPCGGIDAPGGPARVRRRRHPSGIQTLEIALGEVLVEARVAPGVPRVDLAVRVDNRRPDHRLRMLFPTGRAVSSFVAATTFDACSRSPGPRDATGWWHPAPSTFPCQGWVWANGLTVGAPGLYEAEVTADGVIAFTLVRSVGWLSRPDLTTRPGPAGPSVPTPGAQCVGSIEARVCLWSHPGGPDLREIRDAELGLRAVAAGPSPLLPPGASLLSLEPGELVLSALKPAEEGEGVVLRVLNPTDRELRAVVSTGFAVAGAEAVRLDETPGPDELFVVPARSLRTVLLSLPEVAEP